MNCQKDDIARITGLPPQLTNASDRFVRCVEACEILGAPAWVLDRPVNFIVSALGRSVPSGEVFKPGDKALFDRIQDKYLRPIRGDLDGDETSDATPVDIISALTI